MWLTGVKILTFLNEDFRHPLVRLESLEGSVAGQENLLQVEGLYHTLSKFRGLNPNWQNWGPFFHFGLLDKLRPRGRESLLLVAYSVITSVRLPSAPSEDAPANASPTRETHPTFRQRWSSQRDRYLVDAITGGALGVITLFPENWAFCEGTALICRSQDLVFLLIAFARTSQCCSSVWCRAPICCNKMRPWKIPNAHITARVAI